MELNRKLQGFAPLITLAVLVLVWWCLALKINSEILLPKPSETLRYFFSLFGDSSFYSSIFYSLLRTISSFLLALALAVLSAVLASQNAFLEKLFYPIVLLVRTTPTMSVIFICIIWFNSSISPMIVAFAVIFPSLYVSTLSGIKECDKDLIEMSMVYKVSKKRMIFDYCLPSVFERVYADSINILSLNLKLIIAAEALAQTGLSIGDNMKIAKETLEITRLFAYTIVSVILSFALELSLLYLRKLARRISYAKHK